MQYGLHTVPYVRASGWGLLITDFWHFFVIDTDFCLKILLTTDFLDVEFND